MSLILPENISAQPEPTRPGSQPAPSTPGSRLSWTDLGLLTVVLGSLVALLACGVGLQESVAVVGVAGLISAELRRRITS
ncbi:hypothetical protein ACFYXM_35965 [Streptomyces sp. NPDC002476]|uniref:hypothetical protein n=1 Tax=Streptomyces sp. NPDC002476 TaxID=3364648 RepID=UPI0036876A75